MDKDKIVHFAVEVLGCGCDHSVFNSIEVSEDLVLGCGVRLARKIVIGSRLLIYITPAAGCLPEDVDLVVREGVAERNRCGYNRLRIVVPADDFTLWEGFVDAFAKCEVRDEKCHIHLVPVEEAV